MTFRALCDGPEDGRLLLLLHGLPRNRWEWHHQIPPMAELGFRVVAPDLRGFCPGARPESVETYHVKEYAQDVLEIADSLGHTGRPFHLMGTSIGATMAWWLAANSACAAGGADADDPPAARAPLRARAVTPSSPLCCDSSG